MQMNMGAEPYFLNQHYKNQLAFLERDSSEGANICNVWVYNFEHELAKISKLLKKYTYVAMVSFQSFPFFHLSGARVLAKFSIRLPICKFSDW